jgi:cob(I)alamin adenosyltransferase
LIDSNTFMYINRLSDYLFMLARTCALKQGQPETIYKKARAKQES